MAPVQARRTECRVPSEQSPPCRPPGSSPAGRDMGFLCHRSEGRVLGRLGDLAASQVPSRMPGEGAKVKGRCLRVVSKGASGTWLPRDEGDRKVLCLVVPEHITILTTVWL